MKTKHTLLLPLIALLLISCNSNTSNTTSSLHEESTSSIDVSSNVETSDVNITTNENNSNDNKTSSETEQNTTTEENNNPSAPETSDEINSGEDIIPSTSETDSNSEEIIEGIPSSGQHLPVGSTTVSGPDNYNASLDISSWQNFDIIHDIPANFSYIYGNNKTNGDLYDNKQGGFRFDDVRKGFQTPVFDSYKKIEFRFTVSQAVRNSKKHNPSEAALHLYGYDITGKYIYLEEIENLDITDKTEKKEFTFYIRNTNVRYLELRQNDYVHNGSKCLNFGINHVAIKGWNYD